MADYGKLLVELTGPNAGAYAAAVTGGSNSDLLVLLNAPHSTATAARSVPSPDVLAAVAVAMKGLTATALQRLQVILAPGAVNFADADTVAEVRDIFAGQTAILMRLAALARRSKSIAEATCDGDATLEDLWAVLPLIPTSHHARNLAGLV